MHHLGKIILRVSNTISLILLIIAMPSALTLAANNPRRCPDLLTQLLTSLATGGVSISRVSVIKKPIEIHLDARPRSYEVIGEIRQRFSDEQIKYVESAWLESMPAQGHFVVTVTTVEQYEAINKILHDNPGVIISAKIVQPIATAPILQPVAEQQIQTSLTQEARSYFVAQWGHMTERHEDMVRFLQHKVLADSAFQNSPEAFLTRWDQERGGFEMLLVPADSVKEFLEELHQTQKLIDFAARAKVANFKVPQGEQVLSAEWDAKSQESISGEVKSYLDKEWAHFEGRHLADILKFILTAVLTDPLFQADPTTYLTRWIQNRGSFEDLRVPQDQAKAFLESLYKSGQLSSFAKKAKQAGLKPIEGVQLFSATWRQ